jgi:hypothetical protein
VSVIEKARPGRAAGPARRPRRRGRRGALVLVLLALLAAAAAFWWTRVRERALPFAPAPAQDAVPEAPPLGAGQTPEPEAAPAPAAPPVEPAPIARLPALAESDAFAREVARGVSSDRLLARALEASGVVERFVVIVDQLAEGNVPRAELDFLRPKGAFLVRGGEPALRVDPASYRRFDAFAAALARLDAAAAAAAYRRLAPLCEEAYRALGYPEGGFEQRLSAALTLLAAAPASDGTAELVAEVKRYEYADPELESLPAAQKQLLRMGPQNAERVREKLREIQAELARPL